MCGQVEIRQKQVQGTFIGEIALWILFIVIGSFTSFLLLLLPFIYTLYSATNIKYACSMCKSNLIIPVDSPNGKKLIAEKDKS